MSDNNKAPAVKVAHQQKNNLPNDGIITLSTGDKARVVPVAANLIQKVRSQIKPPPVPMWYDENKGKDVENPNSPDYVQALKDLEQERGLAVVDALILFGVELLDGVPEDKSWLKKLALLKIEVDQDDPLDVEFAYKKYIAVSSDDLIKITKAAGLQTEAIQERLDSFRDQAE